MSSVQELSSGMLVCDFLACSEKIASYKKIIPFFPSFFQQRLMKKLSDSTANVTIGGAYVSSFMMILWWLWLPPSYFPCHALYNMSNKWLQAFFFCGGWSVGSSDQVFSSLVCSLSLMLFALLSSICFPLTCSISSQNFILHSRFD